MTKHDGFRKCSTHPTRYSATLALLSFKAEPLCPHTLYLFIESVSFFIKA